MNGAERIAAERVRQTEELGYTPNRDAEQEGKLMNAALCYLGYAYAVDEFGIAMVLEELPGEWPWDHEYWKPTDSTVRNLVKAGALVAAAIDAMLAGGRD